jgi:hypothetical protein
VQITVHLRNLGGLYDICLACVNSARLQWFFQTTPYNHAVAAMAMSQFHDSDNLIRFVSASARVNTDSTVANRFHDWLLWRPDARALVVSVVGVGDCRSTTSCTRRRIWC